MFQLIHQFKAYEDEGNYGCLTYIAGLSDNLGKMLSKDLSKDGSEFKISLSKPK